MTFLLPLVASMAINSPIDHPAGEFLPVFFYPSEAIENEIPRSFKVQEDRSAHGTVTFVIDTKVDLSKTPQWSEFQCRWEGVPPYERRICENIVIYGVNKQRFKDGHILDYQVHLEVSSDRRSLSVKIGNENRAKVFNATVPKIFPGTINLASVKLQAVDQYQSFAKYVVEYDVLSLDPNARIRFKTFLSGSLDNYSAVRIDKVDGEIPLIPSIFSDIESAEAFEFFKQQTLSGDIDFLDRFLSLNWGRIDRGANNIYERFIFSALRSTPGSKASKSSRLRFLQMLPAGDPLITDQEQRDPYTILERNYQFTVYSGFEPKEETYLLLRMLIEKGAKIVGRNSLSDLRNDLTRGNLRISDSELRELIITAAKKEGNIP